MHPALGPPIDPEYFAARWMLPSEAVTKHTSPSLPQIPHSPAQRGHERQPTEHHQRPNRHVEQGSPRLKRRSKRYLWQIDGARQVGEEPTLNRAGLRVTVPARRGVEGHPTI